MSASTWYERNTFQEALAILFAEYHIPVNSWVYAQTQHLAKKSTQYSFVSILLIVWTIYLKLNSKSIYYHLPEAQIYSQLSRLDKSSTSSRAALFLFGATVNSGQNKRSQIAVNMECARGIDEVWEDELGDKASSCVAEEDVSSFSIEPSLDLEPKIFLKMVFCSSSC